LGRERVEETNQTKKKKKKEGPKEKMELSWPPGSLLFDDGAVAFYTKFGIGKETIILGL
jgi:hypothetical protein